MLTQPVRRQAVAQSSGLEWRRSHRAKKRLSASWVDSGLAAPSRARGERRFDQDMCDPPSSARQQPARGQVVLTWKESTAAGQGATWSVSWGTD